MSVTVRPFLMFEGKAEAAMNFYVSLFAGATIGDVKRYAPESRAPKARSRRRSSASAVRA